MRRGVGSSAPGMRSTWRCSPLRCPALSRLALLPGHHAAACLLVSFKLSKYGRQSKLCTEVRTFQRSAEPVFQRPSCLSSRFNRCSMGAPLVNKDAQHQSLPKNAHRQESRSDRAEPPHPLLAGADMPFGPRSFRSAASSRAPSQRPPFTVGDLRKAVPAHCFRRSFLTSTLYLLVDLALVRTPAPASWSR